MKLKYFLILLFLLSFSIENLTFNLTHATVRFVSKTGTSTPPYTSWQTAADSIQKCIDICVDGDTVYVANGIYKEALAIYPAITLLGSSMDSTVIDGTGINGLVDDKITIDAINNIIIENFKIIGRGFIQYTIAVRSYYNDYFRIKNCKISNSENGVGGGVTNCEFLNLIISNVVYTGIGVWTLPEPIDTFLYDNNIISLISSDGNAIAEAGEGIHIITNNILLSNQNSEAIDLEYEKVLIIKNNIISGFLWRGIADSGPYNDTSIIHNNLFFSVNPQTSVLMYQGKTVSFKNNVIAYNGVGVSAVWDTLATDYNIYWQNTWDVKDRAKKGTHDKNVDPMFVNEVPPHLDSLYDFHLQAYSPGIDAGDPGILDKDGSRSDIGLFGGPGGESYTYQDLAPRQPRNLSAVVDSNYITLKWNRNTETDTAYYKVYRDTVINFQIDSTKLVSSSSDSFFVQTNPHNVTRYVYKVTCVDNQGNESLPSTELVVNITSVSTNDYPMTVNDYQLYQNYPNPFNPSTKIGYKIKERGYVKVMVYDIKGELVSVLVNKEQNAGYYEVDFVGNGLPSVPNTPGLASGIYLYRIEVIGEGRIPVFSDMKKMLMIK